MKQTNPVLARLAGERDSVHEQVDQILAAVEAEERDPSEAERELLKRQKARLDSLEPQIVQLVEMEEQRRDARDARALVRSRFETPEEGEGEGEGEGTGNGEGEGEGEGAAHYRTFAQYARDQLLVRFPFIAAQVDQGTRHQAARRLTRAVEAVKSADVAGLIRPQYVAEIVGTINKTRPIVQRSRSVVLVSGKVQYPKIGTAPTVAEQVTEKTEVGVGTMTVTMEEEVAKTFLTSANFSWQTVQWSNPDALALWFDLAAMDYAKKTEAEAAAKLAAVDATPTAIAATTLEAWVAAITAAAGGILSASGRYVDTIYADVASGYELLALVSNTSPTFLATGGGDLAAGRYPSIGGLQLVISPQLPANTVVVGDSSALLTAETGGAPVELRAVEPSIGGLEIGIIGAFAAEITDATAFAELTPA